MRAVPEGVGVTVRLAPLAETAASLRDGVRAPDEYVAELYERIDALEPDVRAWVGGPKPRAQAAAEAAALAERHPDPERRPPLYGVPVGVKDIFHVDGLPTRAGSTLPPGELAGPQAAAVTALRAAGAFVLGKTVTAEFAHFEPGPTRNPHDLSHTPGGSSSGSAAAVAAGMCPLALGTQTIGSVVRPASFCGIVGFKPSHGRIPSDGVIPVSPAVDDVGLFTQDVAGAALAASVLVDDWAGAGADASAPADAANSDRPVLGVPDGAYLAQAEERGREAFEASVDALSDAGFEVRRVEAFDDVRAINARHDRLVAAEMARSHRVWFERYGDRYADATADLIRTGREVSVGELADARAGCERLRGSLAATMEREGVDAWVSPGAPGPAPEGIDDTGDPVMNLPWTHAGVPAVAVPAGDVDGLPVGVQCTAGFGDDERLLAWAGSIADAFDGV